MNHSKPEEVNSEDKDDMWQEERQAILSVDELKTEPTGDSHSSCQAKRDAHKFPLLVGALFLIVPLMIVTGIALQSKAWVKKKGLPKKDLSKNLGTCASYKPRTKQDAIAMNDYIQYTLDFSTIQHYVMFFGFARSGHSWIGSCLDASPNAMIANEFHTLVKVTDSLKENNVTEKKGVRMRQDLFTGLAENSFLCGKYGRVQVYNYSIPGLWQGQVEEGEVLCVIGDKKGGGSTKWMLKIGHEPWSNKRSAQAQKSFFQGFLNFVGIEPRLIVVLRNPFDQIATSALRRKTGRSDFANITDEMVKKNLDKYREVLWARENLAKPHQWHMLTMESFAVNTGEEMMKLCEFTGIKCPPKMMAAVEKQTHHKIHKTLEMVSWTQGQKDQVNTFIRDYLKGYY